MSFKHQVDVVWFRNDLRISDHGPLYHASHRLVPIVALVAWEPAWDAQTSFGFAKTGEHRKRFWWQSVVDLRMRLREKGIPLVVAINGVLDGLNQISDSATIEALHGYAYDGTEEIALQDQVTARLNATGQSIQWYQGHTLLAPDELPFDIRFLPDTFTVFRQKVEAHWYVPRALPEPKPLESDKQSDVMVIFDHDLDVPDMNETHHSWIEGGETAGLQRLEEYIFQSEHIKHYKETRNGLMQRDDSSKLSPWLAFGCLSARTVYEAVRRFERTRIKNDSTYWLVFELLWRDYFQFLLMRWGRKLFKRDGIKDIRLPWHTEDRRWHAWIEGRTGYPLVDAAMRELKQTGWMSNRTRQVVACFLTKYLGVDWRIGAAWFESQLIDYDPANNYGNWTYVAGVGNDPRGYRVFSVLKQAEQYDPKGLFVRQWVPELTRVPAEQIHQPHLLSGLEQLQHQVHIGKDYPYPMMDGTTEIQRQEQAFYQAKTLGTTNKRKQPVASKGNRT